MTAEHEHTNTIKLTPRYPDSRTEDIADAWRRGFEHGMSIQERIIGREVKRLGKELEKAERRAERAERIARAVRCAECAFHGTDAIGDYCEIVDAYLPEMQSGFCAWGASADSSEKDGTGVRE